MYIIENFMFEDLELKGTDLNVFALIYFEKNFKGSLEEISKAVGVKSLSTIQYSLKRLLDKKYIIKKKAHNPFFPSTYIVNKEVVENATNKK